MRIAIRVDSSLEIGTGHIVRCLALAEELRNKDAQAEFFCQKLPGNVASLVTNKGFQVHFLNGDDGEECALHFKTAVPRFDGLVVDHYRLDAKFERPVRPHVGKLLVIDDLADRPHDCDFLTDPNFGENMEARYSGLVPPECKLLLGPSYALLRNEFSAVRSHAESLRSKNTKIERLLIFFGGIDLTDETSKTLDALDQLGRTDLAVDVVLGKSNPRCTEIQTRLGGRANSRCFVQTGNMAELMLSSQLAIGAGGTTSWERCCLGLPSLVISVADNQTQASIDLSRAGYHFYLGYFNEVSKETLVRAIVERLEKTEETHSRGLKGMQLVDGLGCRKIASVLTD